MSTQPALFRSEMVSDQKRLARGEHLLLARTRLRIRDGVHHRPWRVLMLAGGSPAGEIAAIRELMPKAHITAVDRSPACLEAAINSGADDVVECELAEWGRRATGGYPGSVITANMKLVDLPKFDVLHLDLCSGANEETHQILTRYASLLNTRGVMILTFSYGRDVSELFAYEIDKARVVLNEKPETDRYGRYESGMQRRETLDRLFKAGLPNPILGRILYLCSQTRLAELASVIAYKGNNMPMCSLLFSKPAGTLSFIALSPGDFELAVVYPDAMNLYDCPAERIESLRRKFAAIKASLTRQLIKEQPE